MLISMASIRQISGRTASRTAEKSAAKAREPTTLCTTKAPYFFTGARLSGIPLRGARQCMESAAIGDDGCGERIVTQHMNVMTAPSQLPRQGTLRRYVAAAVPVSHEYAQARSLPHVNSPVSLLMMPTIRRRTSSWLLPKSRRSSFQV